MERSECDDPRVAVDPNVLSESRASAAETKHKALDTASSHGGSRDEPPCGESWRTPGERGPPEATACRQFFAPGGDWDVPPGFAKNGDTIVLCIFHNSKS